MADARFWEDEAEYEVDYIVARGNGGWFKLSQDSQKFAEFMADGIDQAVRVAKAIVEALGEEPLI